MHERLLSIFALVVAARAAACVDVTPISAAPPAADAGVEASTELEDDSCVECTSGAAEAGPSCAPLYATCEADPKCLSMFLCGVSRGCYAPGSDLVSCLTTCATSAGVTGMADPAVGEFTSLYGCATTTCASACAAH